MKDGDAASQPFDISSVPKLSREQAAQEVARTLPGFAIDSSFHRYPGPSSLDTIGAPVTRTTTPAPPPQTAEETQSSFAQKLAQVPEFASYGAVINSSKSVQLTENETEYQVSCVKHLFQEHVVFQVSLSHILSSRVISEATSV